MKLRLGQVEQITPFSLLTNRRGKTEPWTCLASKSLQGWLKEQILSWFVYFVAKFFSLRMLSAPRTTCTEDKCRGETVKGMAMHAEL